MAESERSFAAVAAVEVVTSPWRREPFRWFFPLGVVLAWFGIGHWVVYATGLTQTYSCQVHGLVQMQAFLMAFAMGFLLTALPRRTQSSPPTRFELAAMSAALVATTAAALVEAWVVAEAAYAAMFLLLLQFGLRRFLAGRAGRKPPAAFVLIPWAMVHGIGGAALVAWSTRPDAPIFTSGLGRAMIEQGVFLCLTLGIGSLVLPLLGGTPPPPDLGSSPRETRKAMAYGAAGAAILASLVWEQTGWTMAGPLLRAMVMALGFAFGADALYRPNKPGLHRRMVWASVWALPVGLVLAALLPDFRVAALHVVFIGGFSVMAFGIATHVSLSHLEALAPLALTSPRPVRAVATLLTLALLARLAADASNTYFDHLAWAAGLWIAASLIWLAFLGPHLLRPYESR